MGNPSLGSKVQTTMSLQKGRHRPSLSVGSALESKLAPHEKLSRSVEKQLASSTTVSPRETEEKSIAAFLGDKKVKRRTRSSLGGSEEFIKGFELSGVAMAAEERKPLSSIPFRGQRRTMSGNVTPKAAESPRAKGTCTVQGVEKNAAAKNASSLFHSPTNLERSISLSRLAHRVIPDADGSTPRCRTGVLREVILPSERGTLAELKRQDLQRGVESKLQTGHRSENGSGRRSSSVVPERKLEGSGASKTGKTAVLYARENDENPSSMIFSTDSWPNHEQMYWNPAYLPVKDIHPVCFETTPKLRTEQPMTSRSLDMGYDLHGFVRRSSFSTVTSGPPPCSSRAFNPSGPEDASKPTLRLGDSLQSESRREKLSSAHIENSYRFNHRDVQLNLNSYPGGLETRSSIESQRQPFPISTPSRKESLLDPTRQDFKNFHSHPLPLPPPSKASQVKEMKDRVRTQVLKQGKYVTSSSDKVSEEHLTEAAFLSSLVCEDDPAGPVLTPEEPKQLLTNSSQVEEIVFIREKEVVLRNISGPGACLRKSTSFEPGLEEKSRIEHEKRKKLRKRRRSVSASGIGAMLLKVVRVSDTGPLETRAVPIAELEHSRLDPVQSGNQTECCIQTTVLSMGQSQPPTTTLNDDAEVETMINNINAVDIDVDYQNCSTVLDAPVVDDCHEVSVEGASENKDTSLRPKEEQLLQVVGDAQEGKLFINHTDGSQSDLAIHGSQEVVPIADSELDTTSWNLNYEQDKREFSSEILPVDCIPFYSANKNGSVITANNLIEELPEERFLDVAGVPEVLDCDAHQRETSSTSGHELKGDHQELEKSARRRALTKNARLSGKSSLVNKEEGPGGSRRNLTQRRRYSYDLDPSTDCRLTKPNISEAANTERERAQATSTDDHSNYKLAQEPLALLDENVTITRESTRPAQSLIATMLQVSPRQSLDDDYHLAPSSISILANPSFSSSHQDRLWEEQAEAYSSGGRGTPGREDDTAATNVFLHSPSPGGAISSDDQIHSSHGSLRKGQGDMSARISASGFISDIGGNNEKRKLGQSKKRGRPRTPLRSLLAEDLHGKTTSNHGRSPERRGHFLQQLMTRLRGSSSSSKVPSPMSQEQAAMPKTRRNTFRSSCLCFLH